MGDAVPGAVPRGPSERLTNAGGAVSRRYLSSQTSVKISSSVGDGTKPFTYAAPAAGSCPRRSGPSACRRAMKSWAFPVGLLGRGVGRASASSMACVHVVVLVRELRFGRRLAAVAEERRVQEVVDAEPVAVPADEPRRVVPGGLGVQVVGFHVAVFGFGLKPTASRSRRMASNSPFGSGMYGRVRRTGTRSRTQVRLAGLGDQGLGLLRVVLRDVQVVRELGAGRRPVLGTTPDAP